MAQGTFIAPIVRRGDIIKSNETLSDEMSEAAGKAIQADPGPFISAVMDGLKAAGAIIAERPEDGAEKMSNFPPILRFPLFYVKVGPYEFHFGVSLTVCNYARNSKVWTNTYLDKVDGGPAQGLTESVVKDFLRIAADCSDRVLDGTVKVYQAVMREHTLVESLTQQYRLSLTGLNSSDENIRKLFSEISDGEVDDFEDIWEKYRDSLTPLFACALHFDASQLGALCKMKQQGEVHISYLEGTDRDTERDLMIDRVGLVAAKTEENIQHVGCFCFKDPSEPDLGHAAQFVSREVADELGKGF